MSLRMRVFAGPNGSGKSTIISSIRQANVNGYPLNFGIYVNADDIARALRNGDFNFAEYQVSATKQDVINVATDSGLVAAKKNFRSKWCSHTRQNWK